MRSLLENYSKDDLSTQQVLTLIGLAGLTTLILAFVPFLGLLNYPFRLLVTIIHELGHGLAALLTGGEFRDFTIRADGSGVAFTAGGWRLIVIPAGYLGAALFGALLITLGRSTRAARYAMGGIGIALVILSVQFGLPGIFRGEVFNTLLTVGSGVIFGMGFLFVAIRANASWLIYLLHVVAIQAGLNAFSDIMTVIGLSTTFFNAPNDAASMAQLTFIPAFVWAILWAIAALVMLGGALWLTWIVPLGKEDNIRTDHPLRESR